MALVKLINEAEATGKVKVIFDDIKATKGIERVPNIWRALANHPDHLEVTWMLPSTHSPVLPMTPAASSILAVKD